MTEFVRVGALAEIPEGELRAYDVPAGRVVVTHDERRLFAVSETCTGQGCALADGSFDDRSDRLLCAACESVFDAETGEPLEGPALRGGELCGDLHGPIVGAPTDTRGR